LSARKREAELRSGVRVRANMVMMWMSGNRGTRRDTMPLNSVTVWDGRSCEKAIKKAIWSGIEPFMVVKLEQWLESYTPSKKGNTYVQSTFPVMANSITKLPKHIRFGIRDATTRNLTNSLPDQALSRYLPP
jgi:uncharacterized membrane protein